MLYSSVAQTLDSTVRGDLELLTPVQGDLDFGPSMSPGVKRSLIYSVILLELKQFVQSRLSYRPLKQKIFGVYIIAVKGLLAYLDKFLSSLDPDVEVTSNWLKGLPLNSKLFLSLNKPSYERPPLKLTR